MCKIILKRKIEYFNLLRSYKIYIDNQYIDKINVCQTKEMNLEQGEHYIQLKLDNMTVSETLKFNIEEK